MNGNSIYDSSVITLSRRERERQQRRADILRSAEAVFAAKGFHDASIEAIAHAAEYATGTVYLYFKDKEALYIELFEAKVHELLDLIRNRIRGERQPLEALRRLVQARMEYFNHNRSFFTIYVREGLFWRGRDHRWSAVTRQYERYILLLVRLIQAAQRRNLLRKGDPRQYAIALSGIMVQLTREWLQSGGEKPLTDQVEFVMDLFLNGAKAA